MIYFWFSTKLCFINMASEGGEGLYLDDLSGEELDPALTQELLMAFRPLVLFDSSEKYFPCSFEYILQNSYLEYEHSK